MVIFSSAGQISKWTAAAAEGMGIVCRIQRRYTQSKWPKKNKQKNSTRKREIQNAITYTAHTNKGERERDI
jgi:hypothetical protein